MNHKGVLFSIDLIIALTIFVMFLGMIYVFEYNESVRYVERINAYELENSMNIVLNNLALGKANCNMINESGVFIRKVAFCYDTRHQISSNDINLGPYNFAIYLPGQSVTLPTGPYLSKDLNLIVRDTDITEQQYLNCFENGDCTSVVSVYVWK